jgi:hypothetical protein
MNISNRTGKILLHQPTGLISYHQTQNGELELLLNIVLRLNLTPYIHDLKRTYKAFENST